MYYYQSENKRSNHQTHFEKKVDKKPIVRAGKETNILKGKKKLLTSRFRFYGFHLREGFLRRT